MSRTTAAGSSITAAAPSTCCRKWWRRCAGGRRSSIDGGFCRGTDMVKAMALGADAVAIGRLYCYALAADGACRRASAMLELLEKEVAIALALLGVRSWRTSTARSCILARRR